MGLNGKVDGWIKSAVSMTRRRRTCSGNRVAPKNMLAIFAAISAMLLVDVTAHDRGFISIALAGGRGAQGNNGANNGNAGGNGNGNNGLGNANNGQGEASGAPFALGDNDQANNRAPSGVDLHGSDKAAAWPDGKHLDLGEKTENWSDYLAPRLDLNEFGRTKDRSAEGVASQKTPKLRGVETRAKDSPRTAQKTDIAIDPMSYSHEQVLAIDLTSAALSRARSLGFKVVEVDENAGGVTTLAVPPEIDALDAIELLKRDLPGEHFSLNRIYRLYHPATGGENDEAQHTEPSTFEQSKRCKDDRCYGRDLISWKSSLAPCARGLKVGVIDTEIDLRHPAFGGRNIIAKRFVPGGNRLAQMWHGTAVLSILGGNPESGTPGLVPDAAFFAASVFFMGDKGDTATNTLTLLKALDWMASANVKLINMSFTGPKDELMQARIENMSDRGFIFVAAAGNDGPTADPAYPAAYPQVIAVTAVGKDLRGYPYANRGPHIDIAGPGVGIWTAVPDAREGYRSGTSFAAPFATAVLSLIGQEGVLGPKEGILQKVKTTQLGFQSKNPIYGRGLVQAPQTCPGSTGRVAGSGQTNGSQH